MATPEQIAALRVLIPDNTEPYMFEDAELAVFIDSNSGDLNLAAADALESIVNQMALTGKFTRVRTDDLQVSEEDTVAWFRSKAAGFRAKAEQQANEDFRVVYAFDNPLRRVPEATAWPVCR